MGGRAERARHAQWNNRKMDQWYGREIEHSATGTEVFSEGFSYSGEAHGEASVYIWKADTVGALFRLPDGASVLDFASYTNPGGGVHFRLVRAGGVAVPQLVPLQCAGQAEGIL